MARDESGRWLAASRWWYGSIAGIALASLLVQIVLIFTGGADANSGDTGGAVSIPVRFIRLFSYFTVDSNIVVAIVCVLLVADPRRQGRWWDALRLNALLAITITGIVYAAVLAPLIQLTGWAQAANVGFHYIVPWAMVAGWLVFGPRPRFRWGTLAAAFILPIVWLAYIFVQGPFTRWYPYPFLDVTTIGLGPALVNAVLVLVFAAVLGLVYLLIDAKVPSILHDPEKARHFSHR
jgi:hypothetical protein